MTPADCAGHRVRCWQGSVPRLRGRLLIGRNALGTVMWGYTPNAYPQDREAT
jgi:hypothetical protein